jgi:hypothetical protein
MDKDTYEQNKKAIKNTIQLLLKGRIGAVQAAKQISDLDTIQEIRYQKGLKFTIYAGQKGLERTYNLGGDLLKQDNERKRTPVDETAMILRGVALANNPQSHSSVEGIEGASTKHYFDGYKKWEANVLKSIGSALSSLLPKAYERIRAEAA